MKIVSGLKSALFVLRVILGLFPNRTKKARRITDAVEPMVDAAEDLEKAIKGGV